MHRMWPIRHALAALPLLLGACGVTPPGGIDAPQPPPLANDTSGGEREAAAKAERAAAPAAQPPATPALPAATAAAPKPEVRAADKPEPKAPSKPAPAQAAAKPVPPPLALDTLEQRLKDTPAIGTFTKLALKNQVDNLLDRFRDHYAGRGGSTLTQLRQAYEQLIQRVHGLLRDGDPTLASAILQSREAIWAVLADPAKFARL